MQVLENRPRSQSLMGLGSEPVLRGGVKVLSVINASNRR